MKKELLLILIIAVICSPQSGGSNPFRCKIPKEPKMVKNIEREAVTYKGFMALGSHKFGLIQIGKKDLEVSEGDVVQEITILKISKVHLKYRYKQKIYHAVLANE